jgi:two-component system, cell cycle response regulator
MVREQAAKKPAVPPKEADAARAVKRLYVALDAVEQALNSLPNSLMGEAVDMVVRLRSVLIQKAPMEAAAKPEALVAALHQPKPAAVPQPAPPARIAPAAVAKRPPAGSAISPDSSARGGPTCSQLANRRRESLRDLVEHIHVLPVSAAAPMRILALQQSNSAGAEDYAQAVSCDAGLCSKILGLANSAWYAPTNAVTRVPAAIAAIGLRNLLPLVFSLSLAGTFHELKLPQSEKDALWRASLLKGVAAREYSRLFDAEHAEEAFIAGLLQDLALPVIYGSDPSAWPEYSTVLDMEAATRRQREAMLCGMDHIELSQAIGRRLGFPDLLLLPNASHHDALFESCTDSGQHLINAARLAGMMPHRVLPQQPVNLGVVRGQAGFMMPGGAGGAHVATALERIPQAYRDLLASLGAADQAGFTKFLQKITGEVARSVESAISQSHRQVTNLQSERTEMESRIHSLEAQAAAGDFDDLTKLLNRRGLLARLDNIFTVAREYHQECGLAFVDIDDFKSINDRCGHAGGDAALAGIGDVFRDLLKGRGVAGRMGGDEFAIIMCSRTKEDAAVVLDEVRQAIIAKSVEGNGVKASLSASIGLAWLGTPAPGCDQEALLAEADRVMYEAKRGGKNRLTVTDIAPKPA